jgi:hypothetical protein
MFVLVTREDGVRYWQQDDECVALMCKCGFGTIPWDFIINIEETNANTCPECGRKYYFVDRGIDIYMEEPTG